MRKVFTDDCGKSPPEIVGFKSLSEFQTINP